MPNATEYRKQRNQRGVGTDEDPKKGRKKDKFRYFGFKNFKVRLV